MISYYFTKKYTTSLIRACTCLMQTSIFTPDCFLQPKSRFNISISYGIGFYVWKKMFFRSWELFWNILTFWLELHSEMENVSTSESKRTNFFGGGFRRGQSEHMAGFELVTTAVGGIASHTNHHPPPPARPSTVTTARVTVTRHTLAFIH